MFSEKEKDILLLIGTIAGVIGAIAAVLTLYQEQSLPKPSIDSQPFPFNYSCEKGDWEPPCPSETEEKSNQPFGPVPGRCKRGQWEPPCKLGS